MACLDVGSNPTGSTPKRVSPHLKGADLLFSDFLYLCHLKHRVVKNMVGFPLFCAAPVLPKGLFWQKMPKIVKCWSIISRRVLLGFDCSQNATAGFWKVSIVVKTMPQDSGRFRLRSKPCRRILEGFDCGQNDAAGFWEVLTTVKMMPQDSGRFFPTT